MSGVQSTEWQREQQAKSLATATVPDRTPWTPEEDAVIADTSLSALAQARRVHRTYYAVTARRDELGLSVTGRRRADTAAQTDSSPFDIQPRESVCPECFTVRSAAGTCLCL